MACASQRFPHAPEKLKNSSLLRVLPNQTALAFGRDMNRVKPGPQPFRQFHGVVVGPEVDEERAGFVVEHVIVDGGDLDAVVP